MNAHNDTRQEWSINPPLPNLIYQWEEGADPVTQEEVHAFFYSDTIELIKQRICDIGRRLWQKEYVDGNGGNISVRVGDNLVLCTPTLISKGFMTPEDICLVDMDGRQKAGIRPSTSEIKTHLAIMKTSGARSCVHAHPANANAFLITGSVPPTGIMPEPDIFFGEVGLAAYATPGSEQNAHNVGETSLDHQCIFMENHGVIVWGDHVEDAYWKLENVDAYCRILLLATELQKPITRVDAASMRDFINIRLALGMPDARAKRNDDKLFNANEFAGRPLQTR
ncbi:class II aldolase/adducin family protein [Aeromonas veronii]|uniref:class II aldolase/adducin family protein n=1 Tax=Aeromonas veronii TaxID=654 RepID=UPI0021D9CA6D|nr:class II aldolase/adducin family protein [Aeromonas veronii]UYB70518.1 class II aldolase/adducin family protein [Aeromonas veronii]